MKQDLFNKDINPYKLDLNHLYVKNIITRIKRNRYTMQLDDYPNKFFSWDMFITNKNIDNLNDLLEEAYDKYLRGMESTNDEGLFNTRFEYAVFAYAALMERKSLSLDFNLDDMLLIC